MDVPHESVDWEWPGSVRAARVVQDRLAGKVDLRDDRCRPARWLAGLDMGFEAQGTITRAAAVLIDATTLQPVRSAVARLPTTMPYIPGVLAFRELPALIAALRKLDAEPDLVFVDGQGIAHPRRLGVAAHFGVVTGLPTIGVAKRRLVGDAVAPGPARGDHSALRMAGEQVGWVVRSKVGCLPLYLSPGHRVSVAATLPETLACLARHRLPEPTRLADRLASRRGLVPVPSSG